MKARMFKKDILFISTYYIQRIKRLLTSKTIDGYVVGSQECDDSHGPFIFTNPGKYFVILRQAYRTEHLGGGGDGLALSICHPYQVRQERAVSAPDGHSNEMNSHLDFETTHSTTVLWRSHTCVLVF